MTTLLILPGPITKEMLAGVAGLAAGLLFLWLAERSYRQNKNLRSVTLPFMLSHSIVLLSLFFIAGGKGIVSANIEDMLTRAFVYCGIIIASLLLGMLTSAYHIRRIERELAQKG